ncbi:MAG: hypothetical protein U0136_13335 [Bdellovibrionota bacterium]
MQSQAGASIVELALVVPVIVILVFTAFPLAIRLKGAQISDSLSRELTSAAYRECIADRSAAGSLKFDPQQCLDDMIATFTAQTAEIAPSATFVVSLYTYDPSTREITLVSKSATNGQQSRVGLETFARADEYGISLKLSIAQVQRLMIGEVFYRENGSEQYASTVI